MSSSINRTVVFRIMLRDVKKYGATPGCVACTETLLQEEGRFPSTGLLHTDECRERMRSALLNDEKEKDRIVKADARRKANEEYRGEEEGADEPQNNDGKEDGLEGSAQSRGRCRKATCRVHVVCCI